MYLKSEHYEQQSEQQSEQVKPSVCRGANTSNSKNARAHVGNFFKKIFLKNILTYARIKIRVRSVRFQCLSGFDLFAHLFALLFAFGFAVRSLAKFK